MNLRKIRETLATEETVDSETENEESEEVKYVKIYGKYFTGIWMEIFKHEPNYTQLSSSIIKLLSTKVTDILIFNNELVNVCK